MIPDGEGNRDDLTLTGSSAGNVFKFTLPDLLREYNSSGTKWEYYVVETQVEGYAPAKYGEAVTVEERTTYQIMSDAKDATDGGVIINQTFGGYELPQSGGFGARLFTILGSILTLTPGAILTLTSCRCRKKQYS